MSTAYVSPHIQNTTVIMVTVTPLIFLVKINLIVIEGTTQTEVCGVFAALLL